jgi:predicted Zn-dependent protease
LFPLTRSNTSAPKRREAMTPALYRGFGEWVALAALLFVLPGQSVLAQTPGASPRPSSGALPTLGDNLELSAGAERRLGDRIAASIYRDRDYIDDPVLEDYMQTIWQPLMVAAKARGELSAELQERFAWDLFLIRDRSINAFALPGGYLGVHLGLIGAVSSRDELAAVLGHELSHITQRHISRLITQQSRQTPWLIGAMILGALAASKNPQAGEAAMVGGQALAAQSQLNFSRDMEREADRVGFGVMTDAGFDSRGVGSMFEKLQQASRINDNGSFPYLRSHPLTTERIAEAQSRLQLAMPAASRPGKAEAEESAEAVFLHAMMAARARVLAAPGVDVLRTMVTEAQRQGRPVQAAQAQVSASDVRSAGALYAGALAAAKLRDFTLARSLAEKLRLLATANPRALNATELLNLELDLLAGVVPASASQIDISKAGTRADLLMQARALLAAGRPQVVSDRLLTWVTAHPKDAQAWQLLAVAYGNQNRSVQAIRADAESRVAELDYGGGLDRLRAAQTMIRSNPASADFVEGSIIDARTRQVDLLVKQQALQDKLDR